MRPGKHALESLRRYAHNRHAMVSQRHVLSDDRWIGMIVLLPEAMADHGGPSIRPPAALIVCWIQEPSRGWLDSQHIESIAADHGSRVHPCPSVLLQHKVICAPPENSRQRSRVP